MLAKIGHVDNDQKKSLCDQRSEKRNDTQVPDLCGIQGRDAGGPLREKQACQDPERSDCAIGGNNKCANVKEYRMHLCKNTAFRTREAVLREESRIRPTGP